MLSMAAATISFQSPHPLRGGTQEFQHLLLLRAISIHPPLAGWDLYSELLQSVADLFQSIHPCGVGLNISSKVAELVLFQSTHPLRGGTLLFKWVALFQQFQSTHPSRGGTITLFALCRNRHISIHPPLAGWDET